MRSKDQEWYNMKIAKEKSQDSAKITEAHDLIETSDKDYLLFRMLHQSHLVVLKFREKELRKYRVTFEESNTLTVINRIGGKPTISDISHISIKGYHTISALINRMAKRGLIKKEKGTAKNPQRIAITEKGTEALRLSLARESIKAAMSVFTEAEKDQLITLLKKMRNSAIHHSALQDTPEIGISW
jgi:DNA-binding MarR family transcriptional regulator